MSSSRSVNKKEVIKMGKALWISRHPMDVEAEEQVKHLFGVEGIDSVDFVFSEDSEKALDELKQLADNYTIFGGVFPSQLWFALLKNVNANLFKGKTMFLIISKSVNAEGNVRKFVYDHLEFLNL